MSALGYNYAGNNPAMFADPSGFCETNTSFGGVTMSASYLGCFPDMNPSIDNCAFCATPDQFGGGIMPADWRNLLHNRCLQDAARNSLVPLGLDTLGLIPVLGGFTKGGKIVKGAGAVAKVARSVLRMAGEQFGHFGAVAIQDGRKTFQGISGAGGLVVGVPGISDGDKVAMAQGALGLATFIPGYGDYAAGLQIGIDLSVTVAKMKACVTH